jgi:hypothetical protein
MAPSMGTRENIVFFLFFNNAQDVFYLVISTRFISAVQIS